MLAFPVLLEQGVFLERKRLLLPVLVPLQHSAVRLGRLALE